MAAVLFRRLQLSSHGYSSVPNRIYLLDFPQPRNHRSRGGFCGLAWRRWTSGTPAIRSLQKKKRNIILMILHNSIRHCQIFPMQKFYLFKIWTTYSWPYSLQHRLDELKRRQKSEKFGMASQILKLNLNNSKNIWFLTRSIVNQKIMAIDICECKNTFDKIMKVYFDQMKFERTAFLVKLWKFTSANGIMKLYFNWWSYVVSEHWKIYRLC